MRGTTRRRQSPQSDLGVRPQPKRSSSSSSWRVVSLLAFLPPSSVRSKIIACWPPPPPNALCVEGKGSIHHGIGGPYFMSQTRAEA